MATNIISQRITMWAKTIKDNLIQVQLCPAALSVVFISLFNNVISIVWLNCLLVFHCVKNNNTSLVFCSFLLTNNKKQL